MKDLEVRIQLAEVQVLSAQLGIQTLSRKLFELQCSTWASDTACMEVLHVIPVGPTCASSSCICRTVCSMSGSRVVHFAGQACCGKRFGSAAAGAWQHKAGTQSGNMTPW